MRVGRSGCAALQLFACCPRVPTDVVASLLGMRHDRSAAQLLHRLRTARLTELESVKPGPVVGSRRIRLWSLTPAGHAYLEEGGMAPPSSEPRGLLPFGRPGRWPDTARQRDTPMLVAAYRLLAEVASSVDRPVRVAAWEHPWIRTVAHTDSGRARRVHLPAAAVLTQGSAACQQARSLLLLPDLGTLPVASYLPVLRRLLELRQATDLNQADEPLLVVGVAVTLGLSSRMTAWQALLEQVARRAGERPLHARVIVHSEAVVRTRNAHRRYGDQAEQALGLVARHPLLEHRQLAALLGTSRTHAGQLVRHLATNGWVCMIRSGETPTDALATRPGRPHPLSVVELTPAGRREAARRLLLPAVAATRHHGLRGSPASTRRFWRHLAHTLGANAVFVAFVLAARRATSRGGDEALEEWRSAAACARGRFRPDGYGCYRRGTARFGFFLEFDRGTEKPRQYAAKLAAYYRYRDSGASRRDYQTFPALLVVTTRWQAEDRFAYQAFLAEQRYGATPVRIFLTTTGHIQVHPDGILGAIWRGPGPQSTTACIARACWLPARPPRR